SIDKRFLATFHQRRIQARNSCHFSRSLGSNHPKASSETGCHSFQVAKRCSYSAVTGSSDFPKNIRSGGFSASTTFKIALRVALAELPKAHQRSSSPSGPECHPR